MEIFRNLCSGRKSRARETWKAIEIDVVYYGIEGEGPEENKSEQES